MSVTRSTSKLAWGLCLVLAGAALVAGTNDITAKKGWSQGMLGAWKCWLCSYDHRQRVQRSRCSARVGRDCAFANVMACAPSSDPDPVQHAVIQLSSCIHRPLQGKLQGRRPRTRARCTRRC